jgi:uncharacterized protein
MELPHDATLLRIFTTTADHYGTEPVYQAIIHKARETGLAGATVLRGPLGFGHSRTVHQGHLFSLTNDLPVVVEIVDSEDKINAFLPLLDEMMGSGLVTLEAAKVLQYGRHRAGMLQRIKDYLGGQTHPA